MTASLNLSVGEKELSVYFPKLPLRANKGMMGRLLVVCGSYCADGAAMSGAAYFAAAAAYRTGAGIVEVFTPKENYSVLASLVPEAVFSLYSVHENEEQIASRLKMAIERSDAVMVGCGLGKSKTAKLLLTSVLTNIDCPLLIDADGLNLMAEDAALWDLLDSEQRKRTVITPHPGEMSRLCGKTVSDILADLSAVACGYAKEKGIVCLLKDHETVITDGSTVYVNHSGNPGMATAGMGDLLAGMIGSMLARIGRDEEANVAELAAVGAYLHGMAGDMASLETGEYSLMASNLLSKISAVLHSLLGKIDKL